MPAGAIQNHDGVMLGVNGLTDGLKVKIHRVCIGVRQGERRAFIVLRTDSAEEIGVEILLLSGDARSCAFARPDTS